MRVLVSGSYDATLARALGAKEEEWTRLDQRSAPLDQIPAYSRSPAAKARWFADGRSHGENKTGAFRLIDSTGHFLHVDTAGGLAELLRAGGTMKLLAEAHDETILEWEVYD